MTPLLTLYAMHIAWGTFATQGDLSFYPGIQLKSKEGAQVPFPEPEIDLIALRGENLVILAECKESTKHQVQEEKAAKDAKQIGKLVRLADHLEAPTVVYASATEFPVEKSALLTQVSSDAKAEIRWLDGYDLLDPLEPIMHPLSHPTVPGQRIEKHGDWGAVYLDWVRRSINNPVG